MTFEAKYIITQGFQETYRDDQILYVCTVLSQSDALEDQEANCFIWVTMKFKTKEADFAMILYLCKHLQSRNERNR